MNVRVRIVFNFFAIQTLIAAVGGDAGSCDWILTVQGFRQRARERFEFLKLMASEQIRVAEATARQRALQQLNALRLFGKVCESHCDFFESAAGDRRLPSDENQHFSTMNTSDVAHPANVRQAGVSRR